jgi:hypothetical protein
MQQEETMPGFACEFDCGFMGTYEECEEHEKKCAVDRRKPKILELDHHSHTSLTVLPIHAQVTSIHAEAFGGTQHGQCTSSDLQTLRPRHLLLVAVDAMLNADTVAHQNANGNCVLGYLLLRFNSVAGFVEQLAVLQSSRRLGVGRALVVAQHPACNAEIAQHPF